MSELDWLSSVINVCYIAKCQEMWKHEQYRWAYSMATVPGMQWLCKQSRELSAKSRVPRFPKAAHGVCGQNNPSMNSNGEETSLLNQWQRFYLSRIGHKEQCLKVREHAENFLQKLYKSWIHCSMVRDNQLFLLHLRRKDTKKRCR